ncbi:MAG: MBL fold metallo-hydrolase [Candidatus Dormibacteraceae bacterium]
MRLAFLGTGAAYSSERYNGAVVVDGRCLLDGGAPLLPHMHRLEIAPGGIDAIFLTHFHGDHVLGLPPFMLHRALESGRPLTIVGPPGVEGRIEKLLRLSWPFEWDAFRQRFQLTYQEAALRGEAAGVPFETVILDHGRMGCIGYRLRIGDRLLVYSGDTQPTPPLDRLVQGADVAIVEATGPGGVPTHSSWEDAAALAARHPKTRFLWNHIYGGTLPGAVSDLEVVDV